MLSRVLRLRLRGGTSDLPAPHETHAAIQRPANERASHVQGPPERCCEVRPMESTWRTSHQQF